ncbi:MAG: BREX-2 system adenine-specific DNA-methyltransferase PglX [Planctomycetota bacterium]|nr:MAG: BREX-2 system adenine-specific DNA-methyltransferase PglX [Planctomycetota bacterium]
MIDRTQLLKDCQALLKKLEKDIRAYAQADADVLAGLKAEYERERAQGITGVTWGAWLEEQVVQAAVAWVLTCVFIRFCEDNGLVEDCWLSGSVGAPDGDGADNLLARAQAQYDAYIDQHPAHSDVQYLMAAIEAFGAIPAAKDLVAKGRNALWTLPVSADGAKLLLAMWREQGADGQLLRDFRVASREHLSDTRFLGDLYQDLSDFAKKRYALLQTPDFVEEFILDYTLEPALDTFGLEGFRIIDPTCGSGHFVLGAFQRILARWQQEAKPGVNSKDLVKFAAESVYGVDVNPFAVAISRFRLLLAAMVACGERRLVDVPKFELHLATGHSLLMGALPSAGRQQNFLTDQLQIMEYLPTYVVPDDFKTATQILELKYHAVVGNPPYIAVKDAAEREAIKRVYSSCFKKWTLSVPFSERFFDLAQPGSAGFQPASSQEPLAKRRSQGAGFVGFINSNNFTKREFGKGLIEGTKQGKEFVPGLLATIDLSHVLDTSGCYIPGHGTPTVILFGRNQPASPTRPVRTVMGIRGEPGRPDDAANGQVWRALVDNLGSAGAETPWLSVVDMERAKFGQHPWSLGGGGADELLDQVRATPKLLVDLTRTIGIMALTAEDEAYLTSESVAKRTGIVTTWFGLGDEVRDWILGSRTKAILTFDAEHKVRQLSATESRILWPLKTTLENRFFFGKYPKDAGLEWYEYFHYDTNRVAGPSITFGEVATHNHFVLCRGGVVFNRTAPVIKLPPEASEDDHLRLLSCLNSSVMAFWLRQVCFPKGGDKKGDGARVTPEAYAERLAMNSTNVEKAPITESLAPQRLALAKRLDSLGQELAQLHPSQCFARQAPSSQAIQAAAERSQAIREEMIFLQEELDWVCYEAYGILDPGSAAFQAAWESMPVENRRSQLGQRAFEIHLARQMEDGEEETSWFSRHHSTPITDIPEHWPAEYQAIVQRRLDLIASNKHIALLEKPEHKRRWQSEPWDKQVASALHAWLCDQLEQAHIWPRQQEGTLPQALSARQIADLAFSDAAFTTAADLYRGHDTYDRIILITELMNDQSVPYAAAWRYTDDGLRKRADWEQVWDLQREEDRLTRKLEILRQSDAEKVLIKDAQAAIDCLDIPVPPRYDNKDFRKTANQDPWKHRGKLDVPKERFISYPLCERDEDPSPLYLWAGYDHLGQAQALISLLDDARNRYGWPKERLIPLLAGLEELIPWLKQWHNELDPTYGLKLGDYFAEHLRGECQSLDIPQTTLKSWQPPTTTRGRGGR